MVDLSGGTPSQYRTPSSCLVGYLARDLCGSGFDDSGHGFMQTVLIPQTYLLVGILLVSPTLDAARARASLFSEPFQISIMVALAD